MWLSIGCSQCRLRWTHILMKKAVHSNYSIVQRRSASKLYSIGKLQDFNNETTEYKPGQIFIHRTFSYRGVILHPWTAKLYDRGKSKESDQCIESKTEEIEDKEEDTSDVEASTELYYQVLVDGRDIPHIRVENLCASYLQKGFSTQLIVVPGIDYVAHEDIIPFTSTEKAVPIQHTWFDKFLCIDPDRNDRVYTGTEELKNFQQENFSWLCLSKVYRETTENIRVTVMPFYMGSVELYNQFWWRYCIRLENLGEVPVQLRERFLLIHSTPVSYEKLRARGVIGKEPKLTLRSPDFQYNSHVPLESSSGFMRGTFTMERADGSMFVINIPVVNLEKTDEDNHEDDVSG